MVTISSCYLLSEVLYFTSLSSTPPLLPLTFSSLPPPSLSLFSLPPPLSLFPSPSPSLHTQSYDSNDREMQGEWLVCFNSELELGKFEAALALNWREEFQIDLEFCEVTDGIVRHRAHRAVELLQSSKHRSDSVTKGRTEFTYSANI